jgi:hypothetical protein
MAGEVVQAAKEVVLPNYLQKVDELSASVQVGKKVSRL